jgi:hypothetical protein
MTCSIRFAGYANDGYGLRRGQDIFDFVIVHVSALPHQFALGLYF